MSAALLYLFIPSSFLSASRRSAVYVSIVQYVKGQGYNNGKVVTSVNEDEFTALSKHYSVCAVDVATHAVCFRVMIWDTAVAASLDNGKFLLLSASIEEAVRSLECCKAASIGASKEICAP